MGKPARWSWMWLAPPKRGPGSSLGVTMLPTPAPGRLVTPGERGFGSHAVFPLCPFIRLMIFLDHCLLLIYTQSRTGIGKLFLKGPDSQYFRLQLHLCSTKANSGYYLHQQPGQLP